MKRKLQVFVSSTFTDLIEERQAAVSAILKAGHIPAGMELFTAADRSQMDIIKNWIDESDVYMLILGGRYGSIEPTTGKSYTELEYDYAVEKGKALFAVVITKEALEKKVMEKGTDFIELKEPKSLADFKDKVLSNMSSFFEDVKDIRLCVHESLSDFSANRKLKGWVSADEIIDTHDLAEEIKKLNEENRQLKSQIEIKDKKISSFTNDKDIELKELYDILSAIEITVPPEHAGSDVSIDTNLLSVFVAFRRPLINGITNNVGMDSTANYLYFTISPMLKVHGLMENEKVTGVKYRRYVITDKGAKLLAYVEKNKVKRVKEKKEVVEE
ncbi:MULTISPECIES: DUF4062 domain-containing protein [Enterobacter]|uniref:DUF4062 domain-containing protein n=1 Tax=Enterobacter TaxID=547 RepID=UPI0010A60016|nr:MULTISPECIES: DUF4062 domain-containing protein [Enterobacter cloacae complex]HDS5592273.1 DUF4062 domain-containing protein [Enterobacter hormaechei subsp. xiangfangensis]ELJ5793347.1 DUF4062 domain-containing protein [Enterobacter roggenkampii]MBT1833754.1 DUF4062 domain-containing protein [Enterobacter cloacae]MCE1352104.1 DUF4062 domain-containing protein [Enterobacter roggenkampii]MCK7303180.1 DUF4062 domain-containing protein [Enterobacter roggenkampii]